MKSNCFKKAILKIYGLFLIVLFCCFYEVKKVYCKSEEVIQLPQSMLSGYQKSG